MCDDDDTHTFFNNIFFDAGGELGVGWEDANIGWH
jgi:hypothetical protein